MPRPPRLQRKNGFWYSEAGGAPRYYGRIGVVPYEDALRHFRRQLAGPEPEPPAPTPESKAPVNLPAPAPTVCELVGKFTAWLGKYRSDRTHEERKRHLVRWCEAVGHLPAASIRAEHLEAFREALEARGHAPDYVKKHLTSVRFLLNQAVRLGWLPPGTSPFSGVEPVKVSVAPLHEADLLTDEEVAALFRFADADLSPICIGKVFRRRRPEEYRTGDANPWRGFEDMVRVYHATGARTSELWSVQVADFQPRSPALTKRGT